MKVFMGQKDLNKDFEQVAMCNSRDLMRSQVYLWFVLVKLKRSQEISRKLKKTHKIS
jgi:hypothetical protein